MAIHDKFVALALRLITKHGRPVTFIEMSSATATPAFPFEGPTNPQAAPTRTLVTVGCFVEPDSLQRLGISTKFMELLQRSDRIVLVPGPEDLEGFNSVSDESKNYGITGIETLRPGLTNILHYVGTMR